MHPDRSFSSGFALAEALVSLVILGMVSVLIVHGIATSKRVWERTQAIQTRDDTVQNAQLALRSVIERTFPVLSYTSDTPTVEYDGAAEYAAFRAPAQDSRRPSELQKYRLFVDDNGDLVLASLSDLAANPNAAPRQVILLNGVQRIELDYFGAAAPDYVPRWQQSWQNQPGLPKIVRLRLEFAANDRRWWPTLMVRPLAAISTACAPGASCGGKE